MVNWLISKLVHNYTKLATTIGKVSVSLPPCTAHQPKYIPVPQVAV